MKDLTSKNLGALIATAVSNAGRMYMMTPLLLPCTSLKWWGLQTARYLSKLTAMMRKMLLQTLILKKKWCNNKLKLNCGGSTA